MTAASREPRPVVLRMKDDSHWGAVREPVISRKVVKIGDRLPGGCWVVVDLTVENGVEHVWLANRDKTPQ
jgi:hypothetical protein